MANPAHLATGNTPRRRPPERFHVFVSYTTREDEVQAVKPIVDRFLNDVLRPFVRKTLGEPPAFYDGYSLYSPNGPRYSDLVLEDAIRFAIEESEVLVAFLSPEYPGSRWCRFEWTTMPSKRLRPWFDLCREPPIPELSDQRPRSHRPSRWACLRPRFLMWLWRLAVADKSRPGSAIVPVIWKGEVDPFAEFSDAAACRPFDWTPCVPGLEASERVFSHLSRHGSVSPAWQWEAESLNQACLESMTETATTVALILEERRREYSRWDPWDD